MQDTIRPDRHSAFRCLAKGLVGLAWLMTGGSVFAQPAEAKTQTTVTISQTYQSAILPDLPQGLTSFGAAVVDRDLFVYGGHTGDAHRYWNESQSPVLYRLNLRQPKAWEQVGAGPRLQGLALVSFDKQLYRLGGFYAKNLKDAEQDLWCSDEFARWNSTTSKWVLMPNLPEPRSSFDAVVADGKVFVVGGWALAGSKNTTWHETAWCFDLRKPGATWESLATPPFTRRALALAACNGKLYAIGGMKQNGGPSTELHVLDLASGKWSAGPGLPGEGMQGFGTSAFALNNSAYATAMTGEVYRLNAVGDAWEEAGKLQNPRFFHRLVPADDKHLIVVGGAHMGSGKIVAQEVIAETR